MLDDYYIITFNSTHHAIASEQRLQSAGLAVRIIPVPTQVTADCGLALRFSAEDFPGIHSLMENIPGTTFYNVHCEGRKKTIYPVSLTSS